MKEQHFKTVFADFKAGKLQSSTGHINDQLLREFFDGKPDLWLAFKSEAAGKMGMDIGPCVFSPLPAWDFLSKTIAIEPLGTKIKDWQIANLGSSTFDGMDLRSIGADVYVPEFAGAIDGVIYCRNMLDHTPHWPFVLSNIGAYAAPGCQLLFWTDIDHGGTGDEGHFDINPDSNAVKRLVEQLGFQVLREYEDSLRHESNWGCVATKQ
jgi:hypothetical protein